MNNNKRNENNNIIIIINNNNKNNIDNDYDYSGKTDLRIGSSRNWQSQKTQQQQQRKTPTTK